MIIIKYKAKGRILNILKNILAPLTLCGVLITVAGLSVTTTQCNSLADLAKYEDTIISIIDVLIADKQNEEQVAEQEQSKKADTDVVEKSTKKKKMSKVEVTPAVISPQVDRRELSQMTINQLINIKEYIIKNRANR